jgi:hypothetical protein
LEDVLCRGIEMEEAAAMTGVAAAMTSVKNAFMKNKGQF